MSEETKERTPCATWTPDCQGKQDYDGRLISISTRYWPRGGGMFFFSTSEPGKGLRQINDMAIKPSAHAAISLNFGEPDENGFGDYLDIVEQRFEGDTEAEVKVQVERWVKERFDEISVILMNHYGTKSKEHL
jgi:hypothetical protein